MTDGREPWWVDGVALEILARACTVELSAVVQLPVESRPVAVARSARRGVRVVGMRRLERVSVPVRDCAAVDAILDRPRAAWRMGERSPAALAVALHDAIAGTPCIGGARGVLALCAVLVFLSANGWLAEGRPAWFTHQLRTLLTESGSAARARALNGLAPAVQRPGEGIS